MEKIRHGSSLSGLPYWKNIDGLRTIAVLSVFLFHLNRNILPGGFVGVDIFFVISGFLITFILVDDINKSEFSIARFYQRRISRIFPALFLVVLSALAAGSFLYSAQDMASLGANSTAAVTSLINMKLIFQGSYFEISPDAQPLLHYWSLAVEEQFYLVFPIYLYIVKRFTKHPISITCALALISFGLCVYLTPNHQPFAFYLLPSRAWELLCGSILAIYRANGGTMPSRLAPYSVWGGLAITVASVAILQESFGFPGWIAAFPVIGTMMMIAPSGEYQSGPNKILSHPIMVAIGKRSYSLYLWHWPVFSFVDYQFYLASDLFRLSLKIGLTAALTMLSYRYVERPAREFLNDKSRRLPLFIGTAVVIAVIAAGGAWLRSALYFNVSTASIPSGGTIVRGGDNGTVVLSGDSEAAMYGATIGEIAREQGFTLFALGTAGKNQLPNEDGTSWPAVEQLVTSKKPDVVILIDLWDKLKGDPANLKLALASLSCNTKQVVIVAQPPMPPTSASREAIRKGERPPFFETAEERGKREANLALLRSLEGPNVRVIDIADLFIGPDGSLRIIGADGRMVYYDRTHLSDTGTKMAKPVLANSIQAALRH